MKQISKKDLIKIITESAQNVGQEMPIDEMAEIMGANPWDANYNGKEKKAQVKARYFTRQHGLDYKGLGAVDVFIYNIRPLGEKIMTTKGEEEGRGVDESGEPKNYRFIVLCHDELPTISEDAQEQSEFEKRFNNWVESMKGEGYSFIKDSSIKVKDDPIGIGKSDYLKSTNDKGEETIKDVREGNKKYYNYRKRFGVIMSEKTGVVNSLSENINIILMKDVRKVMDEQEFVNHLGSICMPYINTPQNLVYPTHTKRCHGTDTYGSRTNEKIRWASNSVLEPFKNVEEFGQYIDRLIENKADQRGSTYNVRQYQSGPRKGMMQFGEAVYVSNLFDVLGEVNGDGKFVWNLSFKGLVGTNIKQGDWMDNLGLRPFVTLTAQTISESSEPAKNGCVLSNPEVHAALENALNDIKNQLYNVKIDRLIDEAQISVRGFHEYFNWEPEDGDQESQTEPEMEPELEPQMEPQAELPVSKGKKVKKITKEAIESMISNILKESIRIK